MRLNAVPLVALLAGGCGAGPSAPSPPAASPSPSPARAVVEGSRSGPTAIVFLDAQPAPGSSIVCGGAVAACAGRIRVRLRLEPQRRGTSLFTSVTLHATNKIACLRGHLPGRVLEAGRPETIEIIMDEVDGACGLPSTLTHMAAGVEGVVEVASRQDWSIHYDLLP